MGQYINVGNAGFTSIRRGQYVDKTGMIAYINRTLGTRDKLTCVSRPRRFGKSFAAQMLCAYYDKSCDSASLFEDLSIAESPDYQKHLNQYDVIYLDMTEFIFEYGTPERIGQFIQSVQSDIIQELCQVYPEVSRQDSLARMLYAITEQTGNMFIIIIDEWDALFREAKENGKVQEDYIRLLRSLFKNTGKTDRMIAAAYMTGILPIKKYGTQSAMTDFREFTMIDSTPLEEYVGFTEREVKDLCENSRLDFEEIQKWYDGYLLGERTHAYSPKSVIDALRNQRISSYWTSSETYESLQLYIDMDFDGLREAIIQMIGGRSIAIDVGSFQNDMVYIKSRDDVLTLLIHLGYLGFSLAKNEVFIPNEEVKREFLLAVKNGKRQELARLIINSDYLLEQTLEMEEEAVENALETAHRMGTAPNYYNNEQALRSVIRYAYISAIDEYQTIQELPGGKGYADVVFLPKKGSDKPAIVVELKWNKTAEAAISQIKDNRYPEILNGISSEILLVGVNYDEKTKEHKCRIEKSSQNVQKKL